MKNFNLFAVIVIAMGITTGYAEETAPVPTTAPAPATAEENAELVAERDTFGKWRISVGGVLNGGVRAKVGAHNLPMPSGYVVPAGSASYDDALEAAQAGNYDKGSYIHADSGSDGWRTENWKLHQDFYKGNGKFEMKNHYAEITSYEEIRRWNRTSDDEMQFGLSFELSRELWLSDEADEHRWGVDFAFAVTYFFSRDIFSANGSCRRIDNVREGDIETTITDPNATVSYDYDGESPRDGYYGYGNREANFFSPALDMSLLRMDATPVEPTEHIATYNYSATGDYRELEMLLMLRPWYELTDWWRVYGEFGVGVSWGDFDSELTGTTISISEDFDQWDAYGVAGLGTMMRLGRFDISFDAFGRFLRDDLDVNGRYLDGCIKRSNWGMRLMAGFEF